MNRLMAARVMLLLLALLVWGYGFRADDARIRLIGIALLAMSLVLRFYKRRRPPADPDSAG